MAKLRGPKWDQNYERYKKILISWLRLQEKSHSDSEFVAAVIMGLSESMKLPTGDNIVDIILEMDEEELYPSTRLSEEELTTMEQFQLKDAKRHIPGLYAITETLRAKYAENEDVLLFNAYDEFDTLKKDHGQSMKDYILQFEKLYKKLERKETKLPDIMLAYKLMKGASLGKDEMIAKVGMGVDKMTFAKMKSILLSMNDGVIQTGNNSKVVPKIKLVKEEPTVLYQEEYFSSEEQENYPNNNYSDSPYEEEFEEVFNEGDNCEQIFYQNRPFKRGRMGNGSYQNRGNGSYQNRGNGSYQNRGNFRRHNNTSTYPQFGKHDDRRPDVSSRPDISSRPGNSRMVNSPSTCKICRSIYHWASQCPHKNESRSPVTRPNNNPETILKLDCMFIDDEELCYLTSESKNVALLDCGAAKTVVGRHWFEVFENSLNDEEKALLKEEHKVSHFKFGDGNPVTSDIVKVIPIKMCGQDMVIKANLVENNVPLLISNDSLKSAKAKINFVQDTIEVGGNFQKLISTPSGHYGIPLSGEEICSTELSSQNEHKVFLTKESDPKKLALHIHKYFAHASPQKLKQFVGNTNHPKREEICKALDQIDCDVCKKYKREAPKPRTCLPMADTFNQTVALDLKFLEGKEIILHAIDLLTRFSTAIIIENKTKEVIVSEFLRSWISIFGAPEQTLCDNGREFCNQDFLDMCQNMNINMKSTAAFSPHSNGVVERHNGILAEMTLKIKEETQCSSSTALCWALQAKNSMSNVYGFSPMQLVMGYNPKIPALDDNFINLGQLERKSSSEIVATNLNAMHQARKAFLEAQGSDRLTRALKGRVYQAYECQYFAGDKVYYRTGIRDTTWHGPGVVIGQYKKLVLVKHGGSFVRVHPSKLILQTRADKMVNSDSTSGNSRQTSEEGHDVTDTGHDTVDKNNNTDEDSSSDEEESDLSVDVPSSIQVELSTHNIPNRDDNGTDRPLDGVNDESSTSTHWTPVRFDEKKGRFILNEGESIRYKASDENSWTSGTVLGPSGTARGVNKNRYNVQDEEGNDLSVFADRLKGLEKLVSSDETETLVSEQQDNSVLFTDFPDQNLLTKIQEAKNSELQNFKDFEVYEEMNEADCDPDIPIISSRWIVNKKGDGRVKARLVARGFEESQYLKSDAPTADKTSQRMFLAIAAMKSWKTQSIDIKAAFLQSDKMDRKVYLKPPSDIKKTGVIWHVKKPLYGLRDAALNWYKSLEGELKNLGCTESILDPALFCFYSENELSGILVSHVDDFLFAGNEIFIQEIIQSLTEKYSISSQHGETFDYVGLFLDQDTDGIKIDQKSFSKGIEPVSLGASQMKDSKRMLNESEKKKYQMLLGKINWLAHQSRPDIAFDAYYASLTSQNPSVEDLKVLNKIVPKIQNGLNHILFPKLDADSLQILAFCDASLTNLPDKVSSGEGFIVCLADKKGRCSLLNWKSKKVQRVVHSTIAAECLSLIDCNGDAHYIRNILEEVLFRDCRKQKIPIKIFTDSIQLRKSLYSTHLVTEKLLRVTIAEMKQVINNPLERTSIHWVKSSSMISDCLTKKGASTINLCQMLENGYIDVETLMEEEEEKLGIPQATV